MKAPIPSRPVVAEATHHAAPTPSNAPSERLLSGKLVCSEQLLDRLFDPGARPSIRWLRSQTKAKAIPHVRIGHLVFFDVDLVRATLETRNLVRHRLTVPRVETAG